ncbi:YihY/virulence factor BrkB family protein [Persicobacter psychrovividus]|uniref:Uncharacterized protein n=1 Tax=Persicobacter psychrovividus TaxID=387638 RepID=A0ABM7VBA9_9BACT|nr:hypothetical protein PEPS_02730 [Persicobacter psychrovividus]
MNILQFDYKKFLEEDIWNVQLKHMPLGKKIGYRSLRVLTLAFNGYVKNTIPLRAAALTYYTLLSIVPVLALAFGVAKGFDLDQKLEAIIYDALKGQQEVATQLVEFSEKMLSNAKGGVVAGIGFLVLFYSVMKLVYSIETSFNDIWQVKQLRSVARKFTDYTTMIIIAPILVIISSSLNVMVVSKLQELTSEVDNSFVNEYLSQGVTMAATLSPYIMLMLLFTVVYLIMPYTKVPVKYAIVAGVIAGFFVQTLQWIYLDLQIGVSSYNAIYGSFAALPLLMIFFQLSWLVVLLGGQLAYSLQSVREHTRTMRLGRIPHRNLRTVGLMVCREVARDFISEKTPPSINDLEERLDVPFFYLDDAVSKLKNAHLIVAVHEGEESDERSGLVPAIPMEHLTVLRVVKALEKVGVSDQALKQSSDFMQLQNRLEQMHEALIEHDLNERIIDIL